MPKKGTFLMRASSLFSRRTSADARYQTESVIDDCQSGPNPPSSFDTGAFRGMLRPRVKRLIDIWGAVLLVVLLLPVLLLIAAIVHMDGGPVLYSHTRVGRGGRPFGCLKFRTMVVDADKTLAHHLQYNAEASAEWNLTRKLRRDPRVTTHGRFLRASSLDELPQLFNVLSGEMSLVGPRPVTSSELEEFYGSATAEYLSVWPGLTGLWQISGRSETTYGERVSLDVSYARNPSIRTDIKILLLTLPAVVRRRGAF